MPKTLTNPAARAEWRRVVKNIGEHALWMPAATALLEAYCNQAVRVREIEAAAQTLPFNSDPQSPYATTLKMLSLQQAGLARMAMRIGVGTAGTSAALGGRKGLAKPNARKSGEQPKAQARPTLRAVGTRGKA